MKTILIHALWVAGTLYAFNAINGLAGNPLKLAA